MEQCKNEWLHLIKALDVHYCQISDDRDAERKGGGCFLFPFFFFFGSNLGIFFILVLN